MRTTRLKTAKTSEATRKRADPPCSDRRALVVTDQRLYGRCMTNHERITVEPDKRSGRPCIRGMRITVDDVLAHLDSGMSEAEILADFPYLEPADIQACLAFANDRAES